MHVLSKRLKPCALACFVCVLILFMTVDNHTCYNQQTKIFFIMVMGQSRAKNYFIYASKLDVSPCIRTKLHPSVSCGEFSPLLLQGIWFCRWTTVVVLNLYHRVSGCILPCLGLQRFPLVLFMITTV